MNRNVWLVGFGILALIGIVMGITYVMPKTEKYRGTLYEPAQSAPDFSLVRSDGSEYHLNQQHGKVVLLFFGYTSCPDVCPTTLAELRKIDSEAANGTNQVQVVFVTVDPERDTPEKIQKYVSIFNPDFIGLSSSESELSPIWKAYGVYREIDKSTTTATGYLVTHTARLYVIDQDGNLRLSYSYGTATEDIVHDLKILFE